MSGWFALRSRMVMKNNAVIFMYHRVLPQNLAQGTDIPVQPGMYVTPASLRLHLSYLKAHFLIISLAELVRRLQAGEDISRCAVITFDDGWHDNYTYAFPILKELKVPATIFLASGFIGTSRWFWPEEISWAILSVRRKRVDVSLLPDALSRIMRREAHMNMEVEESSELIISEMKSWAEPQRLSVAKSCALLREKTAGESERLLMNWDEAREMLQSRMVTFGSHTVSHAMLDQLPLEQVQRELVECAADIHSEIDVSAELFAFPNGNYTQQVLSMLPSFGITAAVTTKRGLVNENSPLLELPRIAVHEDVSHTQALFQWRLFVR
jgi:peptidoglycan/xylan/chitin deacetylase (PgdA/CDA1 family)